MVELEWRLSDKFHAAKHLGPGTYFIIIHVKRPKKEGAHNVAKQNNNKNETTTKFMTRKVHLLHIHIHVINIFFLKQITLNMTDWLTHKCRWVSIFHFFLHSPCLDAIKLYILWKKILHTVGRPVLLCFFFSVQIGSCNMECTKKKVWESCKKSAIIKHSYIWTHQLKQ